MNSYSPGARRALLLSACVLVALAYCASAARGEAPAWRYAPALAPPPPPGVTPAPYPVPLGPVGQISFWAPNRGLLITGGSGPVPAGLYAYDGVSWHQLSSVCGGSGGRIAWAGPDEFWTISDQRGGQELPSQAGASLASISLCHFLNGQVVGSYAMPLEQPDSYLRMDAAACYGPSDCWFGGEDGASPNIGAFHLHWNGSSVSTVYAPEDHAVMGMVNFESRLYESVQIRETDVFPPSGSTSNPAVIHTIAPTGSSPFTNLYLFPTGSSKTLPEYSLESNHKPAPPWALEGFTLASDGVGLGAGATQLWAVANATYGSSSSESLTVLHCVETACANGEWSQVAPKEATTLAGYNVQDAPAPEPGSESVWLSLGSEVGHLTANGVLEELQTLPGPQEAELGELGGTGAITCPAAHDCWMATTEGWLFHLTTDPGEPTKTEGSADTDPFFDGEDPVIAFRPEDEGTTQVYSNVPPADDSLANQITLTPPGAAPESAAPAPVKRKQGKALVTHVKSKFVHHRLLVISFTLTAGAHVQLLGRRGGKVIASTRNRTFKPGRHRISLTLNPAHWPSKLQFKALPLSGAAPVGEGPVEEGSGAGPEAGSGGGSNTVVTG